MPGGRYITFGPPNWSYIDVVLAAMFVGLPRYRESGLSDAIAEVMDFPHVCTTNLGRSAIRLAVNELNPTRSGKIILPSLICPTVVNALLAEGHVPFLVDVDDNLHVSRETLEKCDLDGVSGLVVAHLYGLHAPIEVLADWSRSQGLFLIDDAAQAVGVKSGDRYLGGYGDAGILSFGPFKSINTPRGGALVLPNASALGSSCSGLSGRESSKGALRRLLSGTIKYKLRPWTFEWTSQLRRKRRQENTPISTAGNRSLKKSEPETDPKARVSFLEATLASRVIRRMDKIIAERSATGSVVVQRIADIPGITVIGAEGAPYHKIPIRVESPQMLQRLIKELKRQRIEVERLYRPLHTMPRFERFATGEYRTSERLWDEVALIPNPVSRTEAAADRIEQSILHVVGSS